jgi:GTP-binding protein EngB required for normal cell division
VDVCTEQIAWFAGTVTARQPSHTRVKSAKFVKSSTTLEQCPPASLPELAVIGRSNVGKSSLVNALTNQSSLAKVSKTPGEGHPPCASCMC